MYKFKLNHSLMLQEFQFISVSLLALIIAILFHEMGHYLASLYYGLKPSFGITFSAIYVESGFINLRVHEIVSHAGPIFNLILAFFSAAFLFIRSHTHDMKDSASGIYFLVLVTNLLVALVSLVLFSFSGVL